MKLTVHFLDKTKDRSFGRTYSNNGRKGRFISLNMRKNKEPIVFFQTIVHEFLHIAFTLVRNFARVKVTNRQEHRFIQDIEDYMILLFVRRFLTGVKK